MNCLEFRRELQIQPQSGDAEFLRHARECARCAEAQNRALAFEAALKSALAVPAPAQLAEAILLKQATDQQRTRQRWRRGGALLALAAGVVLAFGIGMRSQALPLAELAVTHLKGEPTALGMIKPLPDEDVRKAFASLGVNVGRLPSDISFVGCCPVGSYSAVHMVMPRGNGAVTVLYLTDDRHELWRKDFVRDGWLGRSVPMGSGTLVLLGHDASQFDRIEDQWRTALQSATST
jgi:hypothetical protein